MESSTPLPAVKLCGELVFSDIIDNICQLLTIKDLYTVAKVCESWKKAAICEMKKRGRPEIRIFPCLLGQDMENKTLKFNALNEIKTKPDIALLFLSRYHTQHMLKAQDLEDVMKLYEKQLECKILAIENEESWFNLEHRIQLDNSGLTIPLGIPSLLLPIYKQSNVLTSWCTEQDKSNLSETMKRMCKELMLYDQVQNLNLIILALNKRGLDIGGTFVRTIHNLYNKQGPCSLWGFECHRLQFVDYQNQEYRGISDSQIPILIGIRILGPNISSWSCIIDNSIQSREFDNHLIKFKENVQLKRYSLGFVCGPALVPYDEDLVFDEPGGYVDQKYHDSLQFMRAIKSTFPEVQFIGAFNYDFVDIYGYDSDDSEMIIKAFAVSIMIISYD